MNTQEKIGLDIESEHKNTYLWLKKYIMEHEDLPSPQLFYLSITKDHLKEDNDYYNKLKKAGL